MNKIITLTEVICTKLNSELSENVCQNNNRKQGILFLMFFKEIETFKS